MPFSIKKFFSLQNYDWSITIIVLILAAIGLAGIYGVDLSRGDKLTLFPTQLLALAVGLLLFFLASSVHVSFYRSSARFFYLLAVVLLVLVLFFGERVRGTIGWFRLGSFSFQPAEFAKVALVIFLAFWINRFGRRYDRLQFVISTFLVTVILAGLIILQPDLGSAVVLLGVWFVLLFLTGTKKRYIFAFVAIGLLILTVAWFFVFKDYQKERLLTFIDPERDTLGVGYNVTQSIIAIGSGKFFGRGLGFGSQSQLHFLPEAQTDFIFSVIAEELGFVGVMMILVLYFFLFWRLLLLARRCSDDFSAFLGLLIMLLFSIQMVINIGGAIGFLPVTGITLPFLSYGGSSLMINFLLIGIAESIVRSSRVPSNVI